MKKLTSFEQLFDTKKYTSLQQTIMSNLGKQDLDWGERYEIYTNYRGEDVHHCGFRGPYDRWYDYYWYSNDFCRYIVLLLFVIMYPEYGEADKTRKDYTKELIMLLNLSPSEKDDFFRRIEEREPLDTVVKDLQERIRWHNELLLSDIKKDRKELLEETQTKFPPTVHYIKNKKR